LRECRQVADAVPNRLFPYRPRHQARTLSCRAMNAAERTRLAVSIARDAAAGSLRERGPLRSAAYLASHCLTVARSFRFRVREALFDREMGIHSDALIDAAALGLKDHEVAGLAVTRAAS